MTHKYEVCKKKLHNVINIGDVCDIDLPETNKQTNTELIALTLKAENNILVQLIFKNEFGFRALGPVEYKTRLNNDGGLITYLLLNQSQTNLLIKLFKNLSNRDLQNRSRVSRLDSSSRRY